MFWIIESPFLKNIPVDDRLAGVLALIYDKQSYRKELLWGHSTASMCIGFMNSSDHEPKAFISELPLNSKPGLSVIIEAKCFK